jgi:phosphoribosyl 1,2-cyclic phosphate phosphodiesterase
MDFLILGSGGAMPIPRPFCQCKVCKSARNGKGKRNHASAFLTKANFLFDAGEDIKESLNRENIKTVNGIFLTHWHPDHSFGLREVLEAYYDFVNNAPSKILTVYLSKTVFKDLVRHFPAINYWVNDKKLAKIVFLEHGESIRNIDTKVTAIGFNGKNSNTFGFLIETNRKRLFYAPCDTIQLNEKFIPKNIDVLVHELGMFSYRKVKTEISFPKMIERIKTIKPRKIFLTHVEEIELQKQGEKRIREIESKYKRLNLKIAFDGLRIKL